MNRKPNLFIIGAMKSGTSSLFRYLGKHPQIFPAPVKEPAHFAHRNRWQRGPAAYLQLFSKAQDQKWLMEGSTGYSKRPMREKVAQRLHDFNPDARVVYVMRDPIERIISQYRHLVRTGRESRTLAEAIVKLRYLANSYYAYQLSPYLTLFGRDAVYLDTTESLRQSPTAFCQRVFRWLGIDDAFVPPNANRKFHSSPSRVQIINQDAGLGKLIVKLTGSAKVGRWPKWLATVAPIKLVLDLQSDEFKEDAALVRSALRPTMQRWISELESGAGMTFDDWPSKRADPASPTPPPLLLDRIDRLVKRRLS